MGVGLTAGDGMRETCQQSCGACGRCRRFRGHHKLPELKVRLAEKGRCRVVLAAYATAAREHTAPPTSAMKHTYINTSMQELY